MFTTKIRLVIISSSVDEFCGRALSLRFPQVEEQKTKIVFNIYAFFLLVKELPLTAPNQRVSQPISNWIRN